jgi:hypothetical protein
VQYRSPQDYNPRNDIGIIKDNRVLDRVDFDLESPRMKKALKNLGIIASDLQKK